MNNSRHVTEIRVREHKAYSVSTYIDPERVSVNSSVKTGSSEIARDLSLTKAQELAQNLGKACPKALVRTLDSSSRIIPMDAVRQTYAGGIYDLLMELPLGTRITAEIVYSDEQPNRDLALSTLTPTTIEPNYKEMSAGELLSAVGDDPSKWAKAFCAMFPGSDEGLMLGWFANAIEHSGDVRRWRKEESAADATQSNWAGRALTLNEADEIIEALQALPYQLAAATRRNAEASGDRTMIELLDRAQVAVDASLYTRGPSAESLKPAAPTGMRLAKAVVPLSGGRQIPVEVSTAPTGMRLAKDCPQCKGEPPQTAMHVPEAGMRGEVVCTVLGCGRFVAFGKAD